MSRQRRLRWRRLLEETARWATELAAELAARGVAVERVILFGSLARGDHTEDSDVDLLVVARGWEAMSVGERLSLLYRLWDKPRDATFIPVTPEELERLRGRSVVVAEALREGIEVYRAPSPSAPNRV